MHYGVHGRLFLSPQSKARPFIAAGGDSETKGGLDLLFDAGPSAHLGIQGIYHDIFTSESSTQYINAGVAVMFDLGGK